MGLQRDRYTVYVQDEQEQLHEYEATVTYQDLLRGEAALAQTGTSQEHYLTLATAWVWASLMRQGDYAGPWQRFRDQDCQGVDKLEPVDVDPTVQETGEGSP